jgi:hypothetical protein
MPNLTDLKMNLYDEDHVDFIMKAMPQLQFLNGLPVERGESDEEISGIDNGQSEEGADVDEYEF